jgi:hypothetical protein
MARRLAITGVSGTDLPGGPRAGRGNGARAVLLTAAEYQECRPTRCGGRPRR